jgi:hypothetical protein
LKDREVKGKVKIAWILASARKTKGNINLQSFPVIPDLIGYPGSFNQYLIPVN